MPEYLGKKYTKNEFLKLIGDPAQIARATQSVLSAGKGTGVSAVNISTGAGLDLSVLPGRGLDIPFCSYKGVPVNFFSGTGITSPGYYEEPEFGWLRSAFFGLLTTCGITSSGFPDEHDGKLYGLHGRISNTSAEDLCISQDWEDDDYVISVSGKLKEVSAFNENMQLFRRIETKLGSSTFIITDKIENKGMDPQPLMMIYHFNFGFPLLSEHSEVVVPVEGKICRDEEAEKDNGLENSLQFQLPVPGYKEKVFFYSMKSTDAGDTFAALVNNDIGNGKPLTAIMKYNVNQLPRFTHWKMAGEQYYVTGLEPGTCGPLGRGKEIESGNIKYLKSGEVHEIKIEIELSDDTEVIKQLRDAYSI